MHRKITPLSERSSAIIFIAVIVIFLISANRAWYYHRVSDGEYWVLDYPPSIPFMWQYDKDANSQLGSTAFFPDYYKVQPHVIDRPTMQAAGWFISLGISRAIQPILGTDIMQPAVRKGVEMIRNSDLAILYGTADITHEKALYFLSRYISAAGGLIIFKIMLYWIAGIMMFRLVRHYSDQNVALFSVLLLFSNSYMINAIGTYHSYEFQVITPIIVVYFFHQLCIRYSISRNILFSTIVGLLFMAKANYAAYIAVLLCALIFVRDRRLLLTGIPISILSHSLPWIIWHIYLETTGLGILGFTAGQPLVGNAPLLHPFSIIAATLLTGEVIQQNSALPGDWISLLKTDAYSSVGSSAIALLQLLTVKFSRTLHAYGSIVGFLAAIGIFIMWRHKNRRVVLSLLGLLFLGCLLQVLFSYPADIYWHDRFVFDPFFIVYGLASVSLFNLLSDQHSTRKRIAILSTVLFIHLSVAVLYKVKLPWVHPFDQHGLYSATEPNSLFRVEERAPPTIFNSQPALSCGDALGRVSRDLLSEV